MTSIPTPSPKLTTTFILPIPPRLELNNRTNSTASSSTKEIPTTPSPQSQINNNNNNNNSNNNNLQSTSSSSTGGGTSYKLVSTTSILNRIGRKLSQTKGSLVRRVSSTSGSKSGLGRRKSSSVGVEGGDLTPPVPILSNSNLSRSIGSISKDQIVGIGRSLSSKGKEKQKEVTFNYRKLTTTSSDEADLLRKESSRRQQKQTGQQLQQQQQIPRQRSQTQSQIPNRYLESEVDAEVEGECEGEGTTSGDRTPMSRTTLNRRLGRSKSEGRRRNGKELEVIMGWGGNEGSLTSGSKLYWEERLGVCWDGREQVHPDLDFVYSSNSDVLPPSARVVFASTLSTFQPRPPLRARLSLPATPKVKPVLTPAAQVKEDYLQACREEERLAKGLSKEGGVVEDQEEGEESSRMLGMGGYEVGEDLDLTPIPTPKNHHTSSSRRKNQYASSVVLDLDSASSFTNSLPSSSSYLSSSRPVRQDQDQDHHRGNPYEDDFSESSSASIHHPPAAFTEIEEEGTSKMSYNKLGARQSEESNTSLESLRVLEVRHRKKSAGSKVIFAPVVTSYHHQQHQQHHQNLEEGKRVGYNLKDEPVLASTRPKFETGLEGESSETGHSSVHWRECE